MAVTREQVSRILAVGSPAPDGVHRLTRGEDFVCCEGSDQEHRDLQEFCRNVEALLQASGLKLQDFSPHEFAEWVTSFQENGSLS